MRSPLAFGLILLLAACAKTPPTTNVVETTQSEPEKIEISGSLTVESPMYAQSEEFVGGECIAPPAYAERISSGVQVILKNQEGTIIATTTLQSGNSVRVFEDAEPEQRQQLEQQFSGGGLGIPIFCQFPFRFEQVADASFYQLEYPGANSGSGSLISKEQLEQSNWQIDLAIR